MQLGVWQRKYFVNRGSRMTVQLISGRAAASARLHRPSRIISAVTRSGLKYSGSTLPTCKGFCIVHVVSYGMMSSIAILK